MIVAIDGPSGTGKSSTSKAVAAKLGLSYLDTGAQYRAITWWMLTNGIDVDDPAAVAGHRGQGRSSCRAPTRRPDDQRRRRRRDRADPHAGGHRRRQRGQRGPRGAAPAWWSCSAHAAARPGGIVVEGRDIGTTVLPDATVEDLPDRLAEARAARRSGELKGTVSVAATQEALIRRDAADSGRKTSPLAKAADAVEVDTAAAHPRPGRRLRRRALVEEKRATAVTHHHGRTARPARRRRRARDRHRPDERAVAAPGARRLARSPGRARSSWPATTRTTSTARCSIGTSPRPLHFLVKQEAFVGAARPVPAGHRPGASRPVYEADRGR